MTPSTALLTPLPPYRLSPSRSSTASKAPVDAPEGTAARPSDPSSRMTSTSTVGLPRESRISRARMNSILATSVAFPMSPRPAGHPIPEHRDIAVSLSARRPRAPQTQRSVRRFRRGDLLPWSVGSGVDGIDTDDAQPGDCHAKQTRIGVGGGNGCDRYADRERDDAEDELPYPTRLITTTGRVCDLGLMTQLPRPNGGQLLNPLGETLCDVFGVLRTELHSGGQCGLGVAGRFLAGSVHGVGLPRSVGRLLLVSLLELLPISGLGLGTLLIFDLGLRSSRISGLGRPALVVFGPGVRPLRIFGLVRPALVMFGLGRTALIVYGLGRAALVVFTPGLRALPIFRLARRQVSAAGRRLRWSGLEGLFRLWRVIPGTGRLGHAASLAGSLPAPACFADPHLGLEVPYGRPYRLVGIDAAGLSAGHQGDHLPPKIIFGYRITGQVDADPPRADPANDLVRSSQRRELVGDAVQH